MIHEKNDHCPICKKEGAYELYPKDIKADKISFSYAKTPECNKTFRVVRCSHCTHVFCTPIPKNIYKNYIDIVDEEYLKHARARELNAKFTLKIIRSYIPSGKLLDVGCATGDFLAVAKEKGYQVEGLELSKWSSKVALKRGILVHRERLQSLARRLPGYYDIITMWGVVEHFEHPLEEMESLRTLLKPKGILVIWTGDVDSITSRLLGRRWWYWQGQHIQYFTHKSLNALANYSGFKHTKTKLYPFVITYALLCSALSRYHLWAWLVKATKIIFVVKPTWALRIPGEMFWIARKK